MIPDFRKKQKKIPNRQVWFMLGAVGVLILCGAFGIADIHVYQKKKELQAQVQGLEQKIADIKKQNVQLQQDIQNADNEQYIEKVAREQLDLQKPGEKVYSFITPQSQQQKNPQSAGSNQYWFGWISGAWHWITGKF